MGALFVWTCSISPCGELEREGGRERGREGGRERERERERDVHYAPCSECMLIEERGKEFCDNV